MNDCNLHTCMTVCLSCADTLPPVLHWAKVHSSAVINKCLRFLGFFNLKLQGYNCGKFHLNRFSSIWDTPQNKRAVFFWKSVQCLKMWHMLHVTQQMSLAWYSNDMLEKSTIMGIHSPQTKCSKQRLHLHEVANVSTVECQKQALSPTLLISSFRLHILTTTNTLCSSV